MGTQTGYCACSHRALNAPTSVLLVLTQGSVRARTGLAGTEARGAIARAGSEACSLLRWKPVCVVFVRLVCHTRHGVRPGRDFGECVEVWNASRYLLGGHPASRTSSHLRCTEQRASNLPPRGSSTAPTVRRAKPHTCVAHEVRTGVCCLPSHGCVARAILRSLRQSQQCELA